MNRYRVLLPVLVNGEHSQGDEFDYEFDKPEDERANIDSGLLEIVPRRYRVTSDSEVYGVRAGDDDPTFEAALLMEPEQFLLEAGHIARVDPEKPKATRKKKVEEEE